MTRRLARARAFALDVSPLRESPSYRALWIGQVVSLIGTQMRQVAVPWQVFTLTHSSAAVGLVGLVEVIPLIAFSLFGGAIADRADRRKIMAVSQVGLLATSALLALSSFGTPPVTLIYALAGLGAAVSGLDRPARLAIVPSLVGPGQISSAVALRQVGFQTTQVVGPSIGGVLIGTIGVGWVYAIDAVSFLAALVALRWVPSSPPAEGSEQSGAAAIKEGLRFSVKRPLVLSIFAIDLVAMVFGMPRAVFPELAREVFRRGPGVLGLLYSAPAVGALAGALSSGWVRKVRRQGVAVIVAVVVWGVAISLAGLSLFSLALTLAFLALAGAADVFSAVFRGTILQEATPDALRGRVSALHLVVVTGGPRLGDLEAGLVAGVVGAPRSVLLGGVACLLGTALVALVRPLRDYRAPSTPAPPLEEAGLGEAAGSGAGRPARG